MVMRSHDLGRRSETIACDYLKARGWTILERNYRAGHKEIDIIARRAHTIAFVEVKARTRGDYGHPLDAIDWRKRRELAFAARAWLSLNPTPGCEYQFDAVSVTWQGSARVVEHCANAWRVR